MEGNMLDWIKKLLASSIITNFIRHGLTSLGAILIAQGLPETVVLPWQSATEALLLQAVPLIISVIWSILEKKYLKAALPTK